MRRFRSYSTAGLSLDETGVIIGRSKQRVKIIRDRALQRAARRYPELRGLVAVDRPEGPALTFSKDGQDAEG